MGQSEEFAAESAKSDRLLGRIKKAPPAFNASRASCELREPRFLEFDLDSEEERQSRRNRHRLRVVRWCRSDGTLEERPWTDTDI